MSDDDFEKRLDAAAKRAQARKEQADEQKSEERAAIERQKAALQAGTSEWNGRILPSINQAVETANTKIAPFEMALRIQSVAGRVISPARVNAELPSADVTIERPQTTGRPHARAATKSRQAAGVELEAAVRVRLRLNDFISRCDPTVL
jgi:hypothetical protein